MEADGDGDRVLQGLVWGGPPHTFSAGRLGGHPHGLRETGVRQKGESSPPCRPAPCTELPPGPGRQSPLCVCLSLCLSVCANCDVLSTRICFYSPCLVPSVLLQSEDSCLATFISGRFTVAIFSKVPFPCTLSRLSFLSFR